MNRDFLDDAINALSNLRYDRAIFALVNEMKIVRKQFGLILQRQDKLLNVCKVEEKSVEEKNDRQLEFDFEGNKFTF